MRYESNESIHISCQGGIHGYGRIDVNDAAAVFVAVVSDSASITAARDFSDAPPAPAAAAAYALLVYLVRGSPYRRLCPPRGAAQLD